MTAGAAAVLLLVATVPAVVPDSPLPPALADVGVTQNLDARLPLEATFLDEQGSPVALGDYFTPGRPVLLNLVYYRCPMLCNVVLEGLVATLRELDWQPGVEFEIVTVSIDPREEPALARAKKTSVLAAYARPEAAAGWHFLTGSAGSVETLAATLGFRYQYLPGQDEYAHPAALVVATPAGRISRYLFGVRQEPRSVRLSLVEAAAGQIGTLADQFLLYCYRYDAATGRYTPVAWRIMRLGGLLTLVALGATLALLWRRESRIRRTA